MRAEMSIRLEKNIESPWTELNPIRVGKISPGNGTPDLFVLVEVPGRPSLRIDVYGDTSEETFAFQDAVLWHKWIAIGFGHKLHLISFEDSTFITIKLDSYFGHLYPNAEFLLAATAKHLHCLNIDGSVRWSSPEIGIDGVYVNHIETETIHGEGEWNSPGGWKPFKIRTRTGEAVSGI